MSDEASVAKSVGLSDDTIGELKRRNGDLTSINTPLGPLVLKRPTRAVYAEFVDTLSKDKASKESAMRKLTLSCVVYPSVADAGVILDAYPALSVKATDVVSSMAGGDKDDDGDFAVKKL
jgi:hypothetical protein